VAIAVGTQEVFALTVMDADGDLVTGSSLTINVQDTVVASGEQVITNLGSTADIADSVLLLNDAELNFDSLAVTARDNSVAAIDYTVSNRLESHAVTADVTLVGGNELQGTEADEVLLSGSGDDILVGGGGDDILIGGAGDDLLSGGSGADTFVWQAGDQSGGVDTITDFSLAEGDALDLRDLLQSEDGGADLATYLHFEQNGSDAVVHISSSGGFAGGYDGAAEDQAVVLQNVDLSGFGSDQEIIQALLASNQLITD
jgi:Ca2+-binding RTX toxin-like protein